MEPKAWSPHMNRLQNIFEAFTLGMRHYLCPDVIGNPLGLWQDSKMRAGLGL